MGCDIHTSVCIKNHKTDKFVPIAMNEYSRGGYLYSVEPYSDRNYAFFGMLANVRGDKVQGIGFYPKDRFSIERVEWPFIKKLEETNLSTDLVNVAKTVHDLHYISWNDSRIDSIKNFNANQLELIISILGFENVLQYYFDEGSLHSHTWFTLKELKWLKKEFEKILDKLPDNSYNNVDDEYEYSERSEVQNMISSLKYMIKNTNRIVKLHNQCWYDEDTYTDDEIVVLIAFDS